MKPQRPLGPHPLGPPGGDKFVWGGLPPSHRGGVNLGPKLGGFKLPPLKTMVWDLGGLTMVMEVGDSKPYKF